MRDIELIIFDLDGVIVSTDEFHYLAWKKIADQEKIFFDRNINHRLRGVSREDSLNIILEKSIKEYKKEEKAILLELKNNYYLNLLENLTPNNLLEGVYGTLIYLKNKKYKIAIGSASKNAKNILDKLNITHLFDTVSDGTNITYGKPNPEVFLYASNNLNIKPTRTAVVEDANSGIDAANRAGMISIGIGPASEYSESKVSIKKIDELKSLFK